MQHIAYIYDIPKEDVYTSKELVQIMNALGYSCDVQIFPSEKPFLKAVIKFQNEVHL